MYLQGITPIPYKKLPVKPEQEPNWQNANPPPVQAVVHGFFNQVPIVKNIPNLIMPPIIQQQIAQFPNMPSSIAQIPVVHPSTNQTPIIPPPIVQAPIVQQSRPVVNKTPNKTPNKSVAIKNEIIIDDDVQPIVPILNPSPNKNSRKRVAHQKSTQITPKSAANSTKVLRESANVSPPTSPTDDLTSSKSWNEEQITFFKNVSV